MSAHAYETNWRLQAAAGTMSVDPAPRDDETLLRWLARTSWLVQEHSRAGRGDRAAKLAAAIQKVVLYATPLELIEMAIERAQNSRPPRRDGTAAEGRYASLAITALEEAEGWEMRRRDAS